MGPLLSLLFPVIGSLTSHSIYMNKDRETGPTGFFSSKKTRKSNCLQMTTRSTSRQLFKDPDRQLVWPGFETA